MGIFFHLHHKIEIKTPEASMSKMTTFNWSFIAIGPSANTQMMSQ